MGLYYGIAYPRRVLHYFLTLKSYERLLSLSISIVTPTRQSCESVLVCFLCTERFYRV